MDLANNRAELLVAELLLKEKNFSEEKVIREFESALRRKELIVIDRKFKDWKAK
jgi:hypothetical protein